MDTKLYSEAAPRRKSPDTIPVDPTTARLTAGGRIIFQRTRWSAPLCNTVAGLAGLGHQMEA